MRKCVAVAAVLAIFLWGARADAQASCKAMGGMSMSEATPPEKMPAPMAIHGVGNASIAISTESAEARMWFTQGLNLFHDFWDYESSRAFEQSVRLDPKCAMCFWGLFEAESFRGESDAWAEAALNQAEKLGKHATPAEKLYIEAAKQGWKEKMKEKADQQRRPAANGKGWSVEGEAPKVHVDSKETKVLRRLVAISPDDVEAKIFLAESLIDGFDKDSKPKPGQLEAQAILAGLLAAHPEDSAANHYWIHAQEAGLHPEAALESARKLGRLSPASGHMVHMPGHIFYRIGDYETARVSFEDSMRTDAEYMRVQGVSVDDDWNYVHNLMYLIADLMEAGRLEEATAMSAKLVGARGSRVSTLYTFSTRDGIARLDPLLPVVLRAGEWQRAAELLQASKPAAELVNLNDLRESLLAYVRGMMALDAKDAGAAAGFSARLDARVAEQATAPKESMPQMPAMPGMGSKDAMRGPVHSFLEVAALELKASVLLAQSKAADADAAFAKAADAERALGYREPPYYIRPVGETRGDALMRAGKFVSAKTAYQAALLERPNSGFPLYGIAQADVAAGNRAAATEDFRALLMAWDKADGGLPQMVAARAWFGPSLAAR